MSTNLDKDTLLAAMRRGGMLQDTMDAVIGALCGKRNAPVREVLVLAIILREAYGKDAVWQLVEDHIFDKPEYAAVRRDAEPLIRKYACS